MSQTATHAILFTDLVDSTRLLSRVGAEAMERVRREHFRLMRQAIAGHRGREVKTVGDAFMVVFDSASASISCAVAMRVAQRNGREQKLHQVAMRVGVSFGEADEDGDDYFGQPVIEASRLCARAEGGQVLVSDLARMLASGRGQHTFRSVGGLELKGLPEPVAASEVLYEPPRDAPFLSRPPFVGRAAEFARLREKLSLAGNGQGGVVMLVGEAGIGKTRAIEEFCEEARAQGAIAITGRCFEGDWAPPYGPFAEALTDLSETATPDELRADMGHGAPALARLVSAIGEAVPGIGEPVPLAPNEEQFRILDAVSQLLLAQAKRAPVVLVLDDLHWADAGSRAMLGHCARFTRGSRLLILGAYRDVELDRQHPLAEALQQLSRESDYERIVLSGLDEARVGELISAIVEHQAAPVFVKAISDETEGNPFFIRETLLHLIEEGKLVQVDGRWRSSVTTIDELGIPESVRQVIGRRLSRLSESTNKLLSAASAFSGPFRFDVAAAGAGIGEDTALDAVDDALEAQVIRATPSPDAYEFTHALIRHTLYSEINPSRQVRLHRRLAEALEASVPSSAGHGIGGARRTTAGSASAAEIAYQYHRSAALPGAERGVQWALKAADEAEAGYAWGQVVAHLRVAQDLMTRDADERLATLTRLARALPFVGAFDEAEGVARDVSEKLFARDGSSVAYHWLWQVASDCSDAGGTMACKRLSTLGAGYVRDDERDAAALFLLESDLNNREEQSPGYIGVYLDTPERRALNAAALALPPEEQPFFQFPVFQSRDEALARSRSDDSLPWAYGVFWAGDYANTRSRLGPKIAACDAEGRLGLAATLRAHLAACCIAMGDLEEGMAALDEAAALSARAPGGFADILVIGRRFELCMFMDAGWEPVVLQVDAFIRAAAAKHLWAAAPLAGRASPGFALLGRAERALELIQLALPAVEQAPKWARNYTGFVTGLAWSLWLLSRNDHADVLERNIREKIIASDFRYPMEDGRLALARLCALQERLDEARHWFTEARTVLEEQGARPLRAICDYDEALALVRDQGSGIREQSFPHERRVEVEQLLHAALGQFRELGMTGWIARAEALAGGGTGP